MSQDNASITVIVITYNEENNIKDCIASAKNLTEKIIHVDTFSTDKTVAVVKSMGIASVIVPHSGIVEPARNAAIASVNTEWFYLLDADERITVESADEIRQTILTTSFSHFRQPRKNIFAGQKWLRYGGWYPDYIIRLIKKTAFVDWPSEIHSKPVIDGEMGSLNQALLHHFHGEITQMVVKTINYEQKVANLLFEAKRTVGMVTFFRKFIAEFLRRYMKKMGFLDGKFGLLEAMYQAYSQTITWIFLWEKYQHSKSPQPSK